MSIIGRYNAFMIRNDGEVFPVIQHLYGSKDVVDIEETIFAGEWLYNHTQNQSTKMAYIQLLRSWIYDIYGQDSTYFDKQRMLAAFETEINSRHYQFLSFDFVKKHISEIMTIDALVDLESINAIVNEELNQEFLRARYGGLYNTTGSNNGEMYFRISSVGYDWFNIIWQFVYDNKNKISTVTVVRDEESTGSDTVYSHNSKKFDKMPVDDFIMLSGRPVTEKIKSILDSYPNRNYKRVIEAYYRDKSRNIDKSFMLFD